MISSRALFLILHLGTSLTSAYIQITAVHILATVFGYRLEYVGLISAVTMALLAFGQWGRLKASHLRWLLAATGMAALCMSAFYGQVVLWGAEHLVGRIGVAIYVLLILFSAGLLISKAVYNSIPFALNYFWHNLLAFLFLGLVIAFPQTFMGAQTHGAIGLFLLVLAVTLPHQPFQTPKSPWNWTALGLGFISSQYVCFAWELYSHLLNPMGADYALFLGFVFLALALAAMISNGRLLKMGLNPLIPLSLFFLSLVIFSAGNSMGPFITVAEVAISFPKWLQSYTSLRLLILLLILGPYIAFALILPSLERTRPGENHLFHVAVGNALGAVAYLIAMPLLSWPWRLVLLFASPGLVIVQQPKRWRSMIWMMCLVLLVPVLFGKRARENIGIQNYFLLPYGDELTAGEATFIQANPKAPLLQAFKEAKGQISFLTKDAPVSVFQRLFINGYSASLTRPTDYVRAFTVQELVRRLKPKRILVMGLGNQLILHGIDRVSREMGVSPQTDVIDNFPLFENQDYVNTIGANSDFTWPRKNFSLILDDVFKFLAQHRYSAPYDLIISNFTWPNYISATNFFTEEFQDLLKAALEPKGLVVSEYFWTKDFECLHSRSFALNVIYPSVSKSSVVLSSNAPLSELGLSEETSTLLPKSNECHKTFSLAHPVSWQIVHGLMQSRSAPLQKAKTAAIDQSSSLPALTNALNQEAGRYVLSVLAPEQSKLLQEVDQTITPAFLPIHLSETTDNLLTRLIFTWQKIFSSTSNVALIAPITENLDRFFYFWQRSVFRNDSPIFLNYVESRHRSLWSHFRSPHPDLPPFRKDLAEYLGQTSAKNLLLTGRPQFFTRLVIKNELAKQGFNIREIDLSQFEVMDLSRVSPDAIVLLLEPKDLTNQQLLEQLRSSPAAKMLFFDDRSPLISQTMPSLPKSIAYFSWLPETEAQCSFMEHFKEKWHRRPSAMAGLYFDLFQSGATPQQTASQPVRRWVQSESKRAGPANAWNCAQGELSDDDKTAPL